MSSSHSDSDSNASNNDSDSNASNTSSTSEVDGGLNPCVQFIGPCPTCEEEVVLSIESTFQYKGDHRPVRIPPGAREAIVYSDDYWSFFEYGNQKWPVHPVCGWDFDTLKSAGFSIHTCPMNVVVKNVLKKVIEKVENEEEKEKEEGKGASAASTSKRKREESQANERGKKVKKEAEEKASNSEERDGAKQSAVKG